MLKRKPKVLTPEQAEEIRTKDFFDMILPGTIKFLSDHYCRRQLPLRVGNSGVSAHYRGTGNPLTACRP